ncbi:MAG: glycosyltransferase family 4 protein [Alteriqipengyuania sp.]
MNTGSKQRDVGVVMLGARMHYAVPAILHRAGRLGRLYTDSYRKTGVELAVLHWLSARRGVPGPVKMFANRYTPLLDGADVVRFEQLAIRNALQRRRLRTRAEKEALIISMAQDFARAALRSGAADHDVIYAFKGAALDLFEATAPGCTRVLEQSILPYEPTLALLQREQDAWGHWYREGVEVAFPAETIAREKREWALADRLVAGSDFVRQGLIDSGAAAEKVVVVPYGVPLPPVPPTRRRSGPLKLLFAGKVGLRKGAHHLLTAIEGFDPAELQLDFAGDCELTDDFRQRYAGRARFLGRVPRAQMQALYAEADVFVLPSIVEGSATVTYEAMAQGLPVITTPNAGSLVEDGTHGRVLPAGDAVALAEAIRAYLDDEALWARHAAAALAMRDEVSTEAYARRLLDFFDGLERAPAPRAHTGEAASA